MIIGFISIYKENILEVKIEIYYQSMGVITKNMFKFLLLHIVVWLRIVSENAVIKNVLMICINRSIQ